MHLAQTFTRKLNEFVDKHGRLPTRDEYVEFDSDLMEWSRRQDSNYVQSVAVSIAVLVLLSVITFCWWQL